MTAHGIWHHHFDYRGRSIHIDATNMSVEELDAEIIKIKEQIDGEILHGTLMAHFAVTDVAIIDNNNSSTPAWIMKSGHKS